MKILCAICHVGGLIDALSFSDRQLQWDNKPYIRGNSQSYHSNTFAKQDYSDF